MFICLLPPHFVGDVHYGMAIVICCHLLIMQNSACCADTAHLLILALRDCKHIFVSSYLCVIGRRKTNCAMDEKA